MERKQEETIRELELDIFIWKELQTKHSNDIEFFHYSQNQIDWLEEELDKISRLENWNEYI